MIGVDSIALRQLHAAIEVGDVRSVRACLKAGVDVNDLHHQEGWPLSHAVQVGHLAICRILLEAGANPNLEDLMAMCIREGRADIAKLLIAHGMTREGMPTYEEDEDRRETSLMRAVRADQPAIVKLLVEAGADANRHDDNDESALLIARMRKSKKMVKLIEPHVSEAERA